MDVGKDQEFTVSTRGAGGQGKLDVKITSPSRRPIPCKLESGTANELHTVKYIPPEEGPYRVDISYDGNPVPGSPFTVEGVMPPDPSKVSQVYSEEEENSFDLRLIVNCFLCFSYLNPPGASLWSRSSGRCCR